MRIIAAAGDGGKHSAHYGKSPSCCDDNPASSFALRLSEQDVGDYSIAEQNEDRCTHKLPQPG